MKLTTKSEYTILAMIHLARQAEDRWVRIEDICDRYGLSKKYLEQLFIQLKQNGYVKARRGSGGGYRLARPANDISIASIVRLMDGALAPTGSVSRFFFSPTPLQQEAKIIAVFQEIRDEIAARLEALKLSDLV